MIRRRLQTGFRPARAFGLIALWLFVWGLAGSATGCEDEIGDSCKSNVDCANDGSRICDRSSPGGYCTIEGCNGGGCPNEAICVAFFPTEFLTIPCDPLTEDAVCEACDPSSDEGCNAFCDPDPAGRACEPCDPSVDDGCNASCEGELPSDACLPSELCLGIGLCARRDTEKRYCMKKCSGSGDCRSGYTCRRTGTGGSELAPKLGKEYPRIERGFCAPR